MKAGLKLKIAFLALLLLLFCWQAVQAPWLFAIRTIEVKDISTLSPWQVEQLAGVSRGMPLLKLDLKQIKSRLEADKRIQQAKVRRSLPSTLVIEITENVGVAAIPYFSNWLELDQTGRVLAVTTQFASLNLPVVTGLRHGVVAVGDQLAKETGWEVAADCLGKMPAALQGEISEIDVSDQNSLVLYSRDPLRILVGDRNNLEKKFAALAATLDRVRADLKQKPRAGQLDVSSGKAVFIEAR